MGSCLSHRKCHAGAGEAVTAVTRPVKTGYD
jgi:hypothetical protein